MARLGGGLKSAFRMSQVKEFVNGWVEEQEGKMITSLQYIGEQFVTKARMTNTYIDDTGNLRSSIGYVILNNGRVVDQNFRRASGAQDGETGALQGMEFAEEVAKEFPEGFVLIGVAGMEYAAAVEAKGYDVITGSAPTREIMKSVLDGIDFGNLFGGL